MKVSFDVTAAEAKIISRIAARAQRLNICVFDQMSTEMDITAVHANGCKLNLQKLLDADDFNFTHDICGIARHLDRDTGKLGNHFDPRCSLPEKAAA